MLLAQEQTVYASDFDGVYNILPGYLDCNLFRAVRRSSFDPAPAESYINAVKGGEVRFIGGLRDVARTIWPYQSAQAIEVFVRCFREEEELNPCPPSREALQALDLLSDLGVRPHVITSNEEPYLERRIRQAGIARYRLGAFSTRECGFAKPDPGVFLPIFRQLDIEGEKLKILYAGDWFDDWRLAMIIGAVFYAVLSGFISRATWLRLGVPPERICDNFLEVAKKWKAAMTT